MSGRGFCRLVADTIRRKMCDIYSLAVLLMLHTAVLLFHVWILFYIIGINDLFHIVWCGFLMVAALSGSPAGFWSF